MITRPVSRSHICLSCRRSLAKHKSPTAYRVARQSTSASTQQTSPGQPQNDTAPASTGNVVRRSGGPPKVSHQPLGRLHGHRGVKVRENLEQLPTTSLGEAANVIVLRDSGITVYEHRDQMKDKRAEHIDILGQLADERGLVGEDEVNKNINGFRPKEGDKPETWDDINAIVRGLQDGFTQTQLEKYIEAFEGKREPISPPEEWVNEEETAPILAITPWQPGISNDTEHFDNDPLRGYFLESHTSKQRVILRLLRECWMLELPELEEGLGQFEIKINLDNLVVLLMGPSSVLSRIRTEHLILEGENLEAFTSREIIRVTTTHAKKDLLVKAVEEAVKSVQKRKIALSSLYPASLGTPTVSKLRKWARKNFDDDLLQELSRMSGTSISRKANNKLLISSTGNRGDYLLTKNDLATRLLLTSGNFSDRVHYQLAAHALKSAEGALIIYPTAKNGLPWRERLRDWTRWTAPTGKENIIPHELREPNKYPLTILFSAPAESREKLKPESTKKAKAAEKGVETPHWSMDFFTETSVLFGSVLHSPTGQIPANVSAKMLADDSFVHTFSSHVPNISRLLSKSQTKLDKEEAEHVIRHVVVHFQPNPFYVPTTGKGQASRGPLGSATLSAFPPLEMVFDIADNPTRTAKLKYIQAVVNEGKKDVMLPGSAVDLRFHQRTTSKLKRRYLKQIEDFLMKSHLDLAGVGPLETPPSITLPISSHICREPGFKVLDGKDAKTTTEGAKDFRDVEYLYTGLEIRRTRAFNYRGWLLLYTSIEGGKAGGARGELRLRPIRHTPEKGTEIMQEEDLVGFAYKVARMITKGGEGNEALHVPVIKRNLVGKDTRVLDPLRSPDMLVRQVSTRELEEPWYFGDKYFAKRPLEWSGDEELVGWKPIFEAEGEGEAGTSKEDAIDSRVESESKDAAMGGDASEDEHVAVSEDVTGEDSSDDKPAAVAEDLTGDGDVGPTNDK